MARHDLLERLGIAHPIFQAPMGGGFSTPELAAAVSNEGGLGSLAAAYQTPDEIAASVRRTRELTARPFGINLFAGGAEGARAVDPAPMLALMAEIHGRMGLEPPVPPAPAADGFPAQLDAVLAARPAIFSFTFGMPDAGALARLRAAGIVVIGTATTVREGQMLEAAGVDAIIAQGAEAGAHRGTFAAPFAASMVPTLTLVAGLAAAVSLPVIGAGGIMGGADIAAVLRAGAAAAALGTAYLVTPESGASLPHKQAILASRADTTVITRAFSGRPARGLANAFTARLAGREDMILPFPLQNALTRAMRNAAAKTGASEYLSLWAGQGAPRARAMPAGALTRLLVAELSAAGPA